MKTYDGSSVMNFELMKLLVTETSYVFIQKFTAIKVENEFIIYNVVEI